MNAFFYFIELKKRMYYDSNVVNNLLNCKICQGHLDEPRLLPCGKTICSQCVSTFKLNGNQYDCLVCGKKHEMNKNGLPINELALEMLSIKTIKLSRNNKSFDSLKETLIDIQKKENLIKLLINNSDDCIKEYCLDLKNEVQLASEKLIQKINDYNEEMFNGIEDYEQELIALNKKNSRRLKQFEIKHQELESFYSETNKHLIKHHSLNDDKIIKLNKNAIILREKADSIIENIREIIFSGRYLMFEANELTYKSVLGEIYEKNMQSSSILLERKQIKELMSLCEFSKDQKWNLIYKGSKEYYLNEFVLKLFCKDKLV